MGNRADVDDEITNLETVVANLEAEVARLRGVMLKAEGRGEAGGCPWCGEGPLTEPPHDPACPAFLARGVVR